MLATLTVEQASARNGADEQEVRGEQRRLPGTVALVGIDPEVEVAEHKLDR